MKGELRIKQATVYNLTDSERHIFLFIRYKSFNEKWERFQTSGLIRLKEIFLHIVVKLPTLQINH